MRIEAFLLVSALIGPAVAMGCSGAVVSETPTTPVAADGGVVDLAEGGTTATVKDSGAPDVVHVDPARCTTPRPAPATVPDDGGVATLPDGGPGFFAKHPWPQVQNNGGPVLKNPRLVPVFFADDPLADELDRFMGSVGCTDYWRAAVNEYGVGDALPGTTARIDEAAPANLTDDQIQAWLIAELTSKTPRLEAPTQDSIYVLFYGEGTSISLQNAMSCEGFGGYHQHVTLPDGRRVAYAVVPRCGPALGSTTDTATGSASHEILEAATDPQPLGTPAFQMVDEAHGSWLYVLGGETADLCAQNMDSYYKPDGFDFTVQRNWSNRAAKHGGDPCLPTRSDAKFFAAAAALPSVVDLDVGLRGRGIVVAPGTNKTIDIDLFDDDSSTPMQVTVMDYSEAVGHPQASTYALDRSTGHGGETLHLTISSAPTASESEMFVVYASKGQRATISDVGVVTH